MHTYKCVYALPIKIKIGNQTPHKKITQSTFYIFLIYLPTQAGHSFLGLINPWVTS